MGEQKVSALVRVRPLLAGPPLGPALAIPPILVAPTPTVTLS